MSGFPANLFTGKSFAVVGLGRNGLPAAHALTAMGAEVLVWDDKPAARDAAAGLPAGDPSTSGRRFDAVVLSPGIPHLLPAPHRIAGWAQENHIPIVSDAELLFQAVRASGSRARFAGITGTNGKSTTTALLAHILTTAGIETAAGGNLGPAALSLPLLGDDGVYVLEMSSYMLERLATIRFHVAAMLNLSADHLDRHHGMTGYALAKRAIFDRQGPSDLAVIGLDDPDSSAMAGSLPRDVEVTTISGFRPADLWCDNGVLRDHVGPILRMADAASLPGAHNAQNAAAATAMALKLGVTREDIARAITSFPGLAHRQQLVGSRKGIAFVNDSKATNADAAARALACYSSIVWIAGGMAKEGGIEPLEPWFPRIRHAMLIGRDAPMLAATLDAHAVPYTVSGTLDAAVPASFAAARRLGAGTVLLSPACASFDQFPGFEVRGERFAELVAALSAGCQGAG
jgi:UDP-N-acetylmuramoylalanine--D-glutamate ligase